MTGKFIDGNREQVSGGSSEIVRAIEICFDEVLTVFLSYFLNEVVVTETGGIH